MECKGKDTWKKNVINNGTREPGQPMNVLLCVLGGQEGYKGDSGFEHEKFIFPSLPGSEELPC